MVITEAPENIYQFYEASKDKSRVCSDWSCFFFRYYSATILQMAGVRDDKQAIWLAAATSATNFVFTLVGVWLVDRVGRRKLTLGSLLGL